MELFAQRAPWWVAGPLIGLVIVGLLWVANQPLGAVGAYVELHRYFKQPRGVPPWRVFFLGGLILGGLLSALVAGGVHPGLGWQAGWGSEPWFKGAALLAGGTLMGFGARIAGGCTAGHGMCGTSLGSPGSFVATGTFMAAAIAGAHILSWVTA